MSAANHSSRAAQSCFRPPPRPETDVIRNSCPCEFASANVARRLVKRIATQFRTHKQLPENHLCPNQVTANTAAQRATTPFNRRPKAYGSATPGTSMNNLQAHQCSAPLSDAVDVTEH